MGDFFFIFFFFFNFFHVEKGPLNPNSRYHLHQIKLHWGGSEHRLNGSETIMEIQLFLYDKNFHANFQSALNYNDGVLGLAFLVTESNDVNLEWQKVFDQVKRVTRPGSVEKIDPIAIYKLIPQLEHLDRYWMYQGSLTTPPCSNTLTWIISQNWLKMTSNQVRFFLHIFNH